MKFSKKIIVAIVLMNVTFTAIVLWLFYRTGSEPMSLIAAWFGFTTVELWSLASIKKTEAKNEQLLEKIITHEDGRGDIDG